MTSSTLPDTTDGAAIATTVDTLRATARSGRTRDLAWRRTQLGALLALLTTEEEALASAVQADLGRSREESLMADVRFTQGEAAHALEHLEEWSAPMPVSAAPMPGQAEVHPEPLGVVLIIGPWNYPLQLVLSPLADALAAGNTAVIKPSEHAPTVSRVLAELVGRYLDPEAVAVVEGDAATTTTLLDQGFDLAFFTGGAAVGRKVMERAARTLTPVVLELGGKSPAVVTADADVEAAAARIVGMKLGNAGQTCVTVDYVLVESAVRERLLTAITGTLAQMRGEAAGGQRVLDGRRIEHLRRLLDGHGGRVLVGGGIDADAVTVEPTVVLDPDPGSALMTEEIFGPVLPIVEVTSFDDAVSRINSGDKPLAAYVFTTDPVTEARAVTEIASGGMVINNVGLHLAVPGLPFGGVGASGMGSYHGVWGFRTFSHLKAVLRQPAEEG